jgi:hypothetical protein
MGIGTPSITPKVWPEVLLKRYIKDSKYQVNN